MKNTIDPTDLPDHLQAALKSIIDEFEKEDQSVRERQIRLWKKMEFYWNGLTDVWWSEVAHDWRVVSYDNSEGYDYGYYDKRMNVFRAYLESIIAAMSSTVPGIECMPDDADNTDDVMTAKGGTKIASLVYNHVNAPLLWCRALYVYCTQGMVAGYNYTCEDVDYGEVKVGKYENTEQTMMDKMCPSCGALINLNDLPVSKEIIEQESDEFDPGPDDVMMGNTIESGDTLCPSCLTMVDPELRENKVIIQKLVGETKKAKSRQMIKVEGGLYVKVPNYARSQKDTPYLSYCYETHYTNVYETYPKLLEKYGNNDTKITGNGGNSEYERWGRLSPQYYGEQPMNTPTVRNWWLRKRAFAMCCDEDRLELEKLFPDGVKTVFINEIFAEARNESLDDHWTLTFNPLSEYLHFDPLGLLLVSVQDITNDLVSLTLQTIEHGIPQTFADPFVLNFEAYRNTEATPGNIVPAKARSGKSLGDGFYTVTTASLGREVQPFADKVQEMGQFVSGALPSLFGGVQIGASKTAAAYSMSRNQALQRLQTTWKMINFWWKEMFGKVIPAYMKTMLDDERIVKKENGSFLNDVIEKARMNGKIGSLEIQSAEELPQTFGQMKDTIMQLMETQNPEILATIGSAENITALRSSLGLRNFVVPGEDDRIKQIDEFKLLQGAEPIEGPVDPMSGQPQEMPSLMPEFEVDNHQIHSEICRTFLVSERGRQLKVNNEAGYKNILLHLKVHMQMLQQLSAPPPMQTASGGTGGTEKLKLKEPVGN